ncbi:MAG: hypothetical protein Q8S73_31960 [Deltaproteobacteria bacterium]|nr:hypothetical protein [Myxococcales bacterium]MDP3218762.1 hypothetical protein [Deltaproteobacteria bacterium]
MDEPIARPPDEYERRYMDADRAVMIAWVRQRLGLRLGLMGLVGVMAAVNLHQFLEIAPRLWALRHQAPLVVGVIFGMYAVLALLMMSYPVSELIGAVTRVVLTPTHLRVHRGLGTTDVPLGAITDVAVERTARWFPKLPALGGVMRRDVVYQSFRTKESLRVEWQDERGRARRVWVYLDQAEALRERVEALRGGATGVRVDVDEEEEGEVGDAYGEEVAAAVARGPRGQRGG